MPAAAGVGRFEDEAAEVPAFAVAPGQVASVLAGRPVAVVADAFVDERSEFGGEIRTVIERTFPNGGTLPSWPGLESSTRRLF